MEGYFVAFVNGQRQDDWSYNPVDGDHVLVAAVPRGDSGKTVLRLAAVVALSYFTLGAGGVAAGGAFGGAATTFAVNAGLFIAGTLAINALFPPPSVDPSDSLSSSPTYQISGQSNQIRPFAPTTYLCGQHRVWPSHAAEPYVHNIFDENFYRALLDCGQGDIQISELKIGEVPIEQYPGAAWSKLVGRGADLKLRRYTREIKTVNVGVDLKQDAPWIVTTTAGASNYVDSVQIEIYLPAGLIWYNSKGKARSHTANIGIEYKKTSEPTIWKRFGEAESFDLSSNDMKALSSANAGIDLAYGSFTRTPYNIDGLTTQPDDLATVVTFVGSEFDNIEDSDPVSSANTKPQLIGFPQGSTTLRGIPNEDVTATSTSYIFIAGTTYTIQNDLIAANGEQDINISPPLVNDFITVPYDWNGDGTYTQTPNYTSGGSAFKSAPQTLQIKNARTTPMTRVITLTFPDRDQYDIRVTRRSADELEVPKDKGGVSQTLWASLREIRIPDASQGESVVQFTDIRTYIEIQIRATDQLSGTLDTINFLGKAQGYKWTGSAWIIDETRNPAWIACGVLMGEQNPNPVPQSRMDGDAWLGFADWCNQLTFNSNCVEPQFRFDHVVDYETTVFELAKSICASARGVLLQRDGLFSVTWDRLQTVPVQLITPQNSWGFSGSRSFAVIPHGVKYKFMDPDRGWQLSERTVYDDGFNEDNATIIDEIPLLGISRATQAWRDGRYFLAQAIGRQEEFTVSMDVENLVCTRGDFVQVQQDAARVGGNPARIKSIAGAVVTLTEQMSPITLDDALLIRQETGGANNIVQYGIVSYDGGGTVTLTIEPTGAAVGDLAVQGIRNEEVGDYLVKQIDHGPDFVATLTLTNLAPQIYTFGDGPIPDYIPPISENAGITPAPPSTLWALQMPVGLYDGPPGGNPYDPANYPLRFEYINGEPHISLLLLWDSPDSAVAEKYEVYYQDGDFWQKIGETKETQFYVYEDENILQDGGVKTLVGQPLSYKVLPVGPVVGLKPQLDQTPTATVTLSDLIDVPSSPQGVRMDDSDGQINISFVAVDSDPSVRGFVIKYNWRGTGANWENSVYASTSSGTAQDTVTLPSRFGSYLIAAVDETGVAGPYTTLKTNVNPFQGTLGVGAVKGDATWSNGVTDNLTIIGDTITLTDPTLEGTFTYSDEIDVGFDINLLVLGLVDASGTTGNFNVVSEIKATSGEVAVMADWVTLASVDPIGEVTAAEVITDWLVTQVQELRATKLNFRIRLQSLDGGVTNPVVTSRATDPFYAEFYVSVPARTEGGSLATDSAVVPITFTDAFYEQPILTFTPQNADNQTTYDITAISRTGFTVDVTTQGNAVLNFNWTASGFGRVQQEDIPT
jgi:hypothetical protein